MAERYFPLFVDLTGRKVVVYGGGAVASRRVGTLSRFGADLTVIAPEISQAIRSVPGVRCREEAFDRSAMPEADLVLAATGDAAVNHAIVQLCRDRGIPVNNASDQRECDFQFPAVAIRGPLVAGINAGGTDHRLVARAAAAIRKLWEEEL